MIKIIFAIVL